MKNTKLKNPPPRPLSIVQVGHPTLWKIAEEIEDTTKISRLATRMLSTLRHEQGVGLAAPQVDKSIRMFVMDIHPTKTRKKLPDMGTEIIINPRIIASSPEMETDWEGCLSVVTIDGLVFGQVERPRAIQVEYTNAKGSLIKGEYHGFAARVFQHEYDHLEGILFLQRMQDLSTLVNETEYRKKLKMNNEE